MRSALFVLSALTLACVAEPLRADHHGRGHESTQGFPGIYSSPRMTMTFTGDGYLIAVVNSSKVAAMVSQYRVDEHTLILRDVSPPAFFPEQVRECVKANDARYALEDDGETVRWTLIDDPCAARAKLYSGLEMNHYVRPQSAAAAAEQSSTE